MAPEALTSVSLLELGPLLRKLASFILSLPRFRPFTKGFRLESANYIAD